MNRNYSKVGIAFIMALCFLFMELIPLSSISFALGEETVVNSPAHAGVALFSNVTLAGDVTNNQNVTYLDYMAKQEPGGYNAAKGTIPAYRYSQW